MDTLKVKANMMFKITKVPICYVGPPPPLKRKNNYSECI
jgi:hypothetical protein